MKKILIIHQSAELYGSDKTILFFITNLDKTKYQPIVILPFKGPLQVALQKENIEVIIAPVLKLYRKIFTPKNILKFFKEYKEGTALLAKLHEKHNFSLVYSHTLAVLIGLTFSAKFKIKHLWHVQEIIAKPTIFNYLFKKILSLKYTDKIVYDSIETMNFWKNGNPKIAAKSDFVWNGLDINSKINATEAEKTTIRKDFFNANTTNIVFGLVGRINSWKGQQLLLEAFNKIHSKYPNIKLVFIGSAPPNQENFEIDLQNKIKENLLEEKVTIIPFQQEIWKFWDSIDIAVVPSTEPEPFGMVAIEAMLAKKPVIAANHGGLTEIVLHNETGFLFEPNNSNSLSLFMGDLINDNQKIINFGSRGFERSSTVFSMEQHMAKFYKIFDEIW